jgi:hypothetical protein
MSMGKAKYYAFTGATMALLCAPAVAAAHVRGP